MVWSGGILTGRHTVNNYSCQNELSSIETTIFCLLYIIILYMLVAKRKREGEREKGNELREGERYCEGER